MALDRRQFLVGGMSALLTMSAPFARALAGVSVADSRSLSFYHIHTGERGNFTYWQKGEYIRDVMLEISWYLRDFRDNSVTEIHKHLLDQLVVLQYMTGAQGSYEVVSAYRSPYTNEMLHKTTAGVDEHSLHMYGKAIDVRLHGVPLNKLHKAALAMQAGGVGYYPESNFIHIDSGIVRSWSL